MVLSETSKQFWRASYDAGMEDMDPKEFEKTFTGSTRHTFENFPDVMALEFLGVEITFKELDALSNKFAHVLLKNGLKKGDRIGINLPNIPQYVIALLGSLKAGLVVSGVSPLLSDEQMHYQLDDHGKSKAVMIDGIIAGVVGREIRKAVDAVARRVARA